MLRLELKSKIVARYRIQGAAAKAMGISESRLSRIVTGLYDPTEAELQKLVAALGPEILKTLSREPVENAIA